MHAVILSGGKQYHVAQGQTIKLEKLDHEVGETFAFEQVLLVAEGENIQCGAPFLSGASVSGEVISQGRHKKIQIVKMRRRKHYMRHQGHRQYYTEVKITSISS
jgi:large subunit ribosomal protein L21